jgi:hypothetical protein
LGGVGFGVWHCEGWREEGGVVHMLESGGCRVVGRVPMIKKHYFKKFNNFEYMYPNTFIRNIC